MNLQILCFCTGRYRYRDGDEDLLCPFEGFRRFFFVAVNKLTTNGEVQSEAILRLTLSFKQQVKV